jgi:hypothetical protein
MPHGPRSSGGQQLSSGTLRPKEVVVDNTGFSRSTNATLGRLVHAVIGLAVLAAPLDGQAPPPLLGEVTAARIVRADRALVLDATEGRVHLVDGQGRAIAGFGRSGSGPREFRAPERLERYDARTFAVIDRANGRLTLLRVELDSIRFAGEIVLSPDLYGFCRAGTTVMGAVRGDAGFHRVTVLDDALQPLRAFGSARADQPPPVRRRVAESRLGCPNSREVIAAEYLGPLVSSYAIGGQERWQTMLPNHRSIRIEASDGGTRFTYPRTGHHSTLEVVPLDSTRVAISLAITYRGPVRDTATERGTVFELDLRTGRVLSERTSPARLRDAFGALRLYDYEDPEPRIVIEGVGPSPRSPVKNR